MCPKESDDRDDSDDFGETDDSERRDESEHRNDRDESEHRSDRREDGREEVNKDEREEVDNSDEVREHDGSEGRTRGRDDPSRIRARPGVGLRAGLREFLNLLRSLDETEEHRGTGHVRGDRSRIDYDVSIGTGFGIEDLRDRPDRRLGRPRGDRPRRRSQRERRSESRSGSESQSDYHVTTREEEDGLVVIGDLPGVGVDELTVGFERGGQTLVVAVEDVSEGRVSLPWPAKAEWSSFNNGVLEVHLREQK